MNCCSLTFLKIKSFQYIETIYNVSYTIIFTISKYYGIFVLERYVFSLFYPEKKKNVKIMRI